MSNSFALLFIAFASVATGDDDKMRISERVVLREVKASILDVFDGGQVLLSMGSDQGVKQGSIAYLRRDEPGSGFYSAKIVQVGASHAVASVHPVEYQYLFSKKKLNPLQVNDSVVWTSFVRTASPADFAGNTRLGARAYASWWCDHRLNQIAF